jgi:hypothetical protein
VTFDRIFAGGSSIGLVTYFANAEPRISKIRHFEPQAHDHPPPTPIPKIGIDSFFTSLTNQTSRSRLVYPPFGCADTRDIVEPEKTCHCVVSHEPS